MQTPFTVVVLMALYATTAVAAGEEVPWWKEQKLVFTWVWDASIYENRFFRNTVRSGCTVYQESSNYQPDNARRAKEYGLKYFAGVVAK